MIAKDMPYWRLSGFYFFYFAVVGTVSPFLGLYLQYLNFSAADIGSATAVLMITRVVAPNVWGWISDVTGKRMEVIRLGSLLACVSFTAIYWQTQFWPVVMVIAAYSFFWNAVLAQFEVVTLNHLHGHTQFYSRIRLWGSVGFIAAVMLLGVLFDATSMAYFPHSVWLFLALIWLMTMVVKTPPKMTTRRSPKGALRALLKQRAAVAFLASGVLLQFSFGSYYTFFSVYLEELGYQHTTIGLLWSLGVVAEIVLFLYVRSFLERFGLRNVMLFTLAVTALRWWLIGYCADWLWLMLFAQLLHAFSFGSAHAVSIEWIRRLFPNEAHGHGQALYSALCFGLGGGLGAWISGWCWELSPLLSFSLSALAAGLAFACVLWGMQGRDGVVEAALK